MGGSCIRSEVACERSFFNELDTGRIGIRRMDDDSGVSGEGAYGRFLKLGSKWENDGCLRRIGAECNGEVLAVVRMPERVTGCLEPSAMTDTAERL